MRARMRAVLGGLTIGFVVALAAVAVATPGDEPEAPQPVKDTASAAVPKDPSGHVAPNYISADPDDPEIVTGCRAFMRTRGFDPEAEAEQLRCEIVVSRAERTLKPGEYTDAGFRAALRAAGAQR
jgi:hypothetical protein